MTSPLRASRANIGKVMLTAQGGKQYFLLQVATSSMPQSCFPVINKVQTMFPPIFIPDKHTRELRIYVNPMSKKFNFFKFY